jgi:putative ABC transport system ATP-binding protein
MTHAVDIEALNLSLGRGASRVHILKNVALHIGTGEAVGLVGPSGSGKSTLLMTIAGLERPDSGALSVLGRRLDGLGETPLAKFRASHLGIVFQSFHLIPTMTALENVAVPLELARVPGAFDRARLELEAVGLGHRTDHFPAQMSGGEQQRVAIARALAPQPRLLLADEPTGNLDEATGRQIADLLFRAQAERGATLVLVTHDNALAARCDRVLRIRSGQLDDARAGEAVA